MQNATRTGSERTSLGEFLLIVGVAVAVALGMSMWIRNSAPGSSSGGIAAGQTAPAIEAAVWVNGEPSGETDKVRVVHAWFVSCPICWEEAPELVRLHEEYGDRVEFIGLAYQQKDTGEDVERFLSENGITWPNGYGEPFTTLAAFEVKGFPAVWVIDREGRIVWNRSMRGSIESGIREALDG